LALKVTVGADDLNARGMVYRLPAPPKSVNGLRIAVWLDEPAIAPVDDSVKQRIDAAARALAKAGAKVDFKARPEFDPAHAHRVYHLLLQANMAARRADFADLMAARARLSVDDLSDHALALRASTASYKEVFDATQQREHLRWAWHDFFGKHDLLLMPITAAPPFRTTRASRCRRVECASTMPKHPYFAQLFWAGLATAALPTVHGGTGRPDRRGSAGGHADRRTGVRRPQHDLARRRTGKADWRLPATAGLLMTTPCW
jgi:amidase